MLYRGSFFFLAILATQICFAVTVELYNEGGLFTRAEALLKEDISDNLTQYHYQGMALRDPFMPPMSLLEDGSDSEGVPFLSPLQKFDLGEMNLIGIWTTHDNIKKALVGVFNQGTRQAYVIKEGDAIGRSEGIVLMIAQDYVAVREMVLRPDGTRLEKFSKLTLGRLLNTQVKEFTDDEIEDVERQLKKSRQEAKDAVNKINIFKKL